MASGHAPAKSSETDLIGTSDRRRVWPPPERVTQLAECLFPKPLALSAVLPSLDLERNRCSYPLPAGATYNGFAS